ncbi:hypothetical protein TWF281_010016 [Arthrobotrys megalospora]
MVRPYLLSVFSKLASRNRHNTIWAFPDIDVPDRSSTPKPSKPTSKPKSKSKSKPIDPLKPQHEGGISKKAKKKNVRFRSRVSFYSDDAEYNDDASDACTESSSGDDSKEADNEVLIDGKETTGEGLYEALQKNLRALRKDVTRKSNALRSAGKFDMTGYRAYVEAAEDKTAEAAHKAGLDGTYYIRQTRKLGAIARPYQPNLCYINASIQALAATRFAHFVKRPDQLAPVLSDGHGLLPVTDRIRDAFRSINQWYDTGFEGSLNARVATGRVYLTPTPDTLGLNRLPFLDPFTGDTPMCDVMEFLEELSDTLNQEYVNERQLFDNVADGSGWVEYRNPIQAEQVTKTSCLMCGYTYVQQETGREMAWVGALFKPHVDYNPDGSAVITVGETLDHFTRVALVETEACISCNLIDSYDIYRRARRHVRARERKEKATESGVSAGTTAELVEIDNRLVVIEKGLRHKLTNQKIPVDPNGRLPGIHMRSEAMTPRAPQSRTRAISHLPDTVILGYDIVDPASRNKNRTQLDIPQELAFAPWTVDTTAGNHSRDPLQPLRPPTSKFNDGIEYECRAIVYHNGGDTNSGHYYTDRLPWIPRPEDVTAGTDSKQPYEWWFCNEALTDIFADDQPFPYLSGAKQQEVLVVYERIMDPADKADIIQPDSFDEFDYHREYPFSEYGIPPGEVKLINKEKEALDKARLVASSVDLSSILSAITLRASKRVRVDEEEYRDIAIPSIEGTRPPKRVRVCENRIRSRGIRSAGSMDHETEKQRRKAMADLHDPTRIALPRTLADQEKKKKWRMGGSYGGHSFDIRPTSDTMRELIELEAEVERDRRKAMASLDGSGRIESSSNPANTDTIKQRRRGCIDEWNFNELEKTK